MDKEAYEWDVFLSSRRDDKGVEFELVRSLYALLSKKSLRVFWEPQCLSAKDSSASKDRERKYLKAAANSAVAVLLVSRRSFTGRDYDMKRYVWSSTPDDLLLEWDLLLELYDRGRVMAILPCLVGDLTNSGVTSAQDRVMSRLGIKSLDEGHLVKRVREIFEFTDKDRSGFIDRQELCLAFKQFGLELSETEVNLMMEQADDDDDAGIDVFEFEDLIKMLLETKCGISFDDGLKASNKKHSAMANKLQESAPKETPNVSSEYFTNFSESGCLPELPNVIMSQSKRVLTSWMHQLNVAITPVLWRDTHLRAVPGLDGPGRSIRQSIACIMGFDAHLVIGNANDAAEITASAIMKKWSSCAAVPVLRWTEGVKVKQLLCFSTGKPAQYIDPITQMPVRDLLIFHQSRQRFYFDKRKCHESILLENHGSGLTYSGMGGHSVLLGPTIAAIGISYVELHIHVLGSRPYMYFGVCDGSHDVQGSWTAASDPKSFLFNCFDGSRLHGCVSEVFSSTQIRQGDRVGLLVDGASSTLEIFINDLPLGVMAKGLPRPLYFVIDVGWPGQSLEILARTHWQVLAQNLQRYFEGLDAGQRDKRVQDLFAEYDTNLSRKVSLEEMRDALQQMGVYMSDREIAELIHDFDDNHNGEIDIDEFREMIEKLIRDHGTRRGAGAKR